MLVDASDESADGEPTPGLGLIRGHCVRFDPRPVESSDDGAAARLKVPHMGWNRVQQGT